MAIRLGGLSSGMDTETVIAQLLAIEGRSQLNVQRRQRQHEARQQALTDVSTRLKTLKTAALDLRSTVTWANKQTVTSSDATKVAAKFTAGAVPGDYSVSVTAKATASQRTYTYTASASATQITIGAAVVDVAANATLQQAVDAINAKSASPAWATAVNGQIVLSNKTTGAASSFTASGATVVEDAAKAKAGTDAQYTLDGVAKTSASNVVTDAIAGVELTFAQLTTGALTISVGAPAVDKAAVVAKVKAFVEAYNSTVDLVKSKVEEKRVVEPKAESDYLKGQLRGDSMLRKLLSDLRTGAMEPLAGSPTTRDELSEIGVSTGATTAGGTLSADAVSGKLVLDEAKLTAALDTDLVNVRQLLGATTGISGIAQRFEGLIDPATATGGTIDQRVTSEKNEVTRLRDRLTDLDRRLELKERNLRARFAAMEKALAASQSQGSWLTAQLR